MIPRHVKQLSEEMVRDGVQRDPIMIDRDSATVLDGMHRLAAFNEMRIENAVCCSVDYGSHAVTLGRWARVFTTKNGSSLEAHLSGFEGARRTTIAEAFESLQRRSSVAAVLTGSSAYLIGTGPGTNEVRNVMTEFDRMGEDNGWERAFIPEEEVDVPLQEKRRFVVLARRLTKDDILSAARSGILFPCKTSMHSIDPRPVAANYPIKELNAATTSTLREKLGGREGRLEPPGAFYGGRRYKERLLFLNED